MLETIDKAIRAADMGLNPINDGKVLKVPVPPLDEERRKEIVTHIKKMMEDEKTVLRNMRRDAKEMIEELEKEKEITEDDKFWGYDKLKEITDEYSGKIEEILRAKEKEILEI
jgi:ribosome recycling factor